ncbi:MAG: accessory gene regulator B family protein [Syntrophomonadaceae bacterium]|nr:accessory gene regulator B family protein [Syntrophomonadaceae bacterium]
MSLYSISFKAAKLLARETELEPGGVDSLRFGLEIILGTLIKTVILLTAAYFLDILPPVIMALGCGSVLRLVSGGVHFSTYPRCLTCGLLIYLAAGEVGVSLAAYLNQHQLTIILAGCFAAMALGACRWAPAEVPYRTISDRESVIFKIAALVFLGALLACFLFSRRLDPSYILAGLGALIAQTFSFTPLGYALFGRLDNWLSNIILGKGR